MSWTTANILVTSLAYLLSTVLFMAHLLRFQDQMLLWARRSCIGAFALHGIAIVHLYFGPAAATTDWVTSLALVVSFGVVCVYVMGTARGRWVLSGAFLAPIVTVIIFSVWAGVRQPRPVAPEVYSVIAPLHIGASLLGIVAFLVAFVASGFYLVQEYQLKRKTLDMSLDRKGISQVALEKVASKAIGIGFPLYTLGIVLGAVWIMRTEFSQIAAQYVLSVASWGIYGVLLYGHVTAGWRGRKAAMWTIIGFLGALSVTLIYLSRSAT